MSICYVNTPAITGGPDRINHMKTESVKTLIDLIPKDHLIIQIKTYVQELPCLKDRFAIYSDAILQPPHG